MRAVSKGDARVILFVVREFENNSVKLLDKPVVTNHAIIRHWPPTDTTNAIDPADGIDFYVV